MASVSRFQNGYGHKDNGKKLLPRNAKSTVDDGKERHFTM